MKNGKIITTEEKVTWFSERTINRKTKKKILSKPTKPIDLEKAQTIKQLVDSFKHSSIQSRNIAKCAEVYERMLTDSARPTIILGLSGALIAGGLRKVLVDMIKYKLVDVIVSTGAILYQDFYQARGYKHYIGSPSMDDTRLREHMIDRIYDTLVDEEKFEETDRYIGTLVGSLEPRTYSTRELLYILGKNTNDKNSILYQAAKHNIPVFSPALSDSSIGIGLTIYYAQNNGKDKMVIDPIRDNYELVQIILKSKKTAAIYVGGGTPKNWINDAEVMACYAFNKKVDGHEYAFQITTDSPHWGGLSGSTLAEAQSWGKISKEATKATVYVEATVSLPLIVGYVMQKRLSKDRPRLKFKWKNDKLAHLTY